MAADVGSLNASLSLDIQSFSAGMSEAINLTRSLGNTLREALGETSQGFSSLNQQASELKATISLLAGEAASLQAQLNMAGVPTAFSEVQTFTSRLQGDMHSAASSADDLSTAAGEAESAVGGITGAAQGTYAIVDATTGELLEMADSLEGAKEAMKQISTEARGNKDATSDAADAAKKLDAMLDRAKKNAGNTAGQTQKISNNLSNAARFATDLKRIIGGIIVSRVFYDLLQVLDDLVLGAVKFKNNMDQAEIAFKFLLGDAQQAKSMILELQDFAIASPLDTQEVMNSTRKLMAMGFTAKSVVPTLRTLADTASVFTSDAGDMDAMLDHITLALGQMRASGKVMSQELRQLYNAGIPVYGILQEELGLTAKEIRNIGKLGIDSGIAVTALLKGLAKRYNGAAEEFTKTIPGAFQVIRDSIFVIYDKLAEVPQDKFKEWVNKVAKYFTSLVEITRAYGPGGLFEVLFTKDMQGPVRYFIITCQKLGGVIAHLAAIIRDAFAEAFDFLISLSRDFGPIIASIANALAGTLHWIYMCVPGVRQLVTALAALLIVNLVASAFKGLWSILRFGKILSYIQTMVVELWRSVRDLAVALFTGTVASWKWLLGLLAVVAVLTAIVMSSDRAKKSISDFIKNFQNLDFGINPEEILQPKFEQEPAKEFDGTLGDIVGDLGAVGDEAEDTGKKIKKSLNQAFDEVFSVKDTEAGSATLGGVDFDKVLADLEAIQGKMDDYDMTGNLWGDWANLQDLKPTVPYFDMETTLADFSTLANDFWEALKDAFSASPEWVALAIAGAIMAVFLMLFHINPLIAVITMAALWVAGLFWPELKKAFNLTDTQGIALAIGASLAAGIIGVTKGSPAGLIIAAVTFFVSWFIGIMVDLFNKKEGVDTWDIAKPLSALIVGAIGFIIAGPAGFAIGTAIGLLAGWVIDGIAKGVETGDWKSTGMDRLIASTIGGIIGGIVGGPVGLVIGQAIGFFWGDVRNLLIAKLGVADWNVTELATKLGRGIVNAILFITTGPMGVLIANALEQLFKWFLSLFGITFNSDKLFQAVGEAFGIKKGITWGPKAPGGVGPREPIMPDQNTMELPRVTSDGSKQTTAPYADMKPTPIEDIAKAIWNAMPNMPDLTIEGANEEKFKIKSPTYGYGGHHDGGIFNKAHRANISEGDKEEAIIPLEYERGMEPFTKAVTKGILQEVIPAISRDSNPDNLRPLHVDVLIADERGLKELDRRLKLIEATENVRRGG